MSEYLHGAYGRIRTEGNRVPEEAAGAIVYVGTAPVHNLAGGAERVNVPITLRNMAEAKRLLGYSDDWASYTLCEAMRVHFEVKGVGPLVMINVLDPETHVKSVGGTVKATPANGRIVIPAAGDIVLDSIEIATLDLNDDYTAVYDQTKKTITLAETSAGSLGTAELDITYDIIDPEAVDDEAVIGTSDGEGLNTGLYAIKNVYQQTGMIPAHLLCPGFSGITEVHAAMIAVSQKINGHWDAWVRADLPLMDGQGDPLTLATASVYKAQNGYNRSNETVYFPMIKGGDGRNYHLSVLAAANFQELLTGQDGIPYKTASNTPCPVIQSLYLGSGSENRMYDDEVINEKLNRYGIASAAFVGGRWVIWGAHAADYNETDGDQINVSETNVMMLYYISNDFQARRTIDIDQPMSINALQSIVSDEQARLDALVKIGALSMGEVFLNAEEDDRSDMLMGDFTFSFRVTTTPLAKSLTAIVNWTDEGFVTLFGGNEEE